MTKTESQIEKIRKLFAKANDAATTEAEALAFMNKVQELLAEHNLSDDVLNGPAKEKLGEEDVKVKVKTSWFGALAVAVSNLYLSGVYSKKVQNKERFRLTLDGPVFAYDDFYVFVGKESNRTIAKEMFGYIMDTIERLSKDFSRDLRQQNEFKKGASFRVIKTIYEKIATLKAPSPASSNPNNLPALYDSESKAVAAYLNQEAPKKARKASFKVNDRDAFQEGFAAGADISLDDQIGSSKVAGYIK